MALSFIIKPDIYHTFEDEAEQIEKCKEWGLLSEKAVKTKTFYYKRNGESFPCRIVGFVDPVTAVIELDDGQRHCIHPSYLKEMQAASYGQKQTAAAGAGESAAEDTAAAEPAGADKAAVESAGTDGAAVAAEGKPAQAAETAQPAAEDAAGQAADASKPPAGKTAGKSRKLKLELPEQKVKMTATVKEFASIPNHFTETDDEVIIYEAVAVTEPELELGLAWSSHSATLKKLALEIGDKLTFEAKVIAKKLTKHPVPYKINNPAKIVKIDARDE